MVALFGAFGVRIDGEQNSGASWDQGRHNPDHNLCLVAFGVDAEGRTHQYAVHIGEGADEANRMPKPMAKLARKAGLFICMIQAAKWEGMPGSAFRIGSVFLTVK